jgi:hypothetical protein
MKGFKRILLWILGLMVAFLLFLVWYQHRYSMDIIEPYQVNSPNLQTKLLIANQGSKFKDSITSAVVDRYKSDSVYIKVIDVSELPEIDPAEFSAILMLHRWLRTVVANMTKVIFHMSLRD